MGRGKFVFVSLIVIGLVACHGTKPWQADWREAGDIVPPPDINASYTFIARKCQYLRDHWDSSDTSIGTGKWFAIGINLLFGAGSTVAVALVDQAPSSDATSRDLKITSLVLGGGATVAAGVIALAGLDSRQNRLRQAKTAVDSALFATAAMWNATPDLKSDECAKTAAALGNPAQFTAAQCLEVQRKVQLSKLAAACGVNPITEDLTKLDQNPPHS